MNKEKFELLAELRIAEKEIAAKIKEILPEVTASVQDLEGGTVIETGLGSFTVAERRTFEYSESIQAQEKALKELKKDEERKGLAECTINKFVKFGGADE